MPADSLFELILIEASLLLAVAATFLGWRLARARRERLALAGQIAVLQRRQVATFLTRELVHTRDIANGQFPSSPQAVRLLLLRQRWLETEQTALVAEGEQKSDYAVIERAAALLLPAESPAEAAGKARRRAASSNPSPERTREMLGRAKAVIELQKEVIVQLKAKVAAAAARNAEPRPDAWDETLTRAQHNTEQQHASLLKLEQNLQGAQDQYRHASSELAGSKARGDASLEHSLLIIQSPSTANVESAKLFLDEMEEAHRASMEELRMMRDTNARQRKLILDLEHQLATLKAKPEEQEASLRLLESLKAQLKEYETCTATLELETEHLRAKIRVLNGLITTAEQSGEINFADKLSTTQRESDVAAQALRRQHQAEELLAIVAKAPSIERAVPVILEWASLNDLECAFLVRDVADKQYWFASENRPIDGTIRQLLQSVVPTADALWTDTRGGPIFCGSVLRVCVQNLPQEPAVRDEERDELTSRLQIIDGLLRALAEPSGGGRHLTANLGQHLDAAVVQHKFLLNETTRIADQLYQELSEYLRNLELPRVQKECLDGMVEDFRTDLHLLARAGGSVEHALKTATLALTAKRTNGH